MHTNTNIPDNDFAAVRCIDAISVPVYQHYLIRNRFEYGEEV
jgi:hypothetical protein